MRVKLFEDSWSVRLEALEEQVNEFLKTLPDGAVKHVSTSTAATRTAETDQAEASYVIAVWYDEKAK